MLWVSWIVCVFVLIILEISTTSMFFFTCFAIGSLAAAVLAFFGAPNIAQYLVCATVSVLSLLIIRPIFQKVMKKSSDVRTNVDSLIGREAVVTQEIAPFKDGFVKVGGEVWLAQSDTIFNEGDIVKVESISGTKVKVTK